PCPASSTTNGSEDPVGGGNCTHFFDGFLPAATLGISTGTDGSGFAVDSWGNRIQYAVTSWTSGTPFVSNVFTSTDGMKNVGISNLSPNNVWRYLQVCSTATGITGSPPTCDSGPPSTALTSRPGVPVVVYSIGKNGASGGAGTDEAENPNPNSANNDRIFVSHPQSPNFDDLVDWISPNILYNRMVTAGKLP
ncbi:MAG: prepilin-type cleavage/methylation domain-containing protein, partial [Gallionella sp.]